MDSDGTWEQSQVQLQEKILEENKAGSVRTDTWGKTWSSVQIMVIGQSCQIEVNIFNWKTWSCLNSGCG